MSECIDKRYESMMHAYELNLLNDDDRQAFELHLYSCDICLEKMRRFSEATLSLRHDPQVRQSIEEISRAADQANAPDTTVRFRWFWQLRRPAIIPSMVIVVLAAVILILKPWQLEISPTKEAEAGIGRLAVLPFANLAQPKDPQNLGTILASLIATSLSQSHYLEVVSQQRVFSLAGNTQSGRQHDTLGLEAVALGKQVGAKWVVTGQIIRQSPQLVAVIEVINAETGLTGMAQRLSAVPGDSIFAAADNAAAAVKSSLALPADSAHDVPVQVAEITTHSPEAYRHFLAGVEDYYKYTFTQAAAQFDSAVACDSTFASAYYWLTLVVDTTYIEKAVKYASGASEQEQNYIGALRQYLSGNIDSAVAELEKIVKKCPDEREALFMIGRYKYAQRRFPEAISYFNRVLAIDSHFVAAYNLLAYGYDKIGDFEKSILAINSYIAHAPHEANPYDSRGDLFALHGDTVHAIESYRMALAKQPTFYASLTKLGHMSLALRDYRSADSIYTLVIQTGNDSEKKLARYFRALLPAYSGRFKEALAALDSCLPPDTSTRPSNLAPAVHRDRAMILWLLGDNAAALTEMNRSVSILAVLSPKSPDEKEFLVQMLASSGEIAKAEKICRFLKDSVPGGGLNTYNYWYALGALAFAQNDFDSAVACFQAAKGQGGEFPTTYMLARSYLGQDNLSAAVRILEQQVGVVADDGRMSLPIWRILLHYYLGLAYEKSRWNDRACRQYEAFLAFWGQANEPITEVADAQSRLKKLKMNH